MAKDIPSRFIEGTHYIIKDMGYKTPCLIWIKCLNEHGYGMFNLYGKIKRVHKYLYEYINNITVNKPYELDHLCHNRNCINIKHLEVVTHRTNSQRHSRKLVTHCPKNHELTIDNTYIYPDGRRECIICRKEKMKLFCNSHLRVNTKNSKQRIYIKRSYNG